MFFLFLYFCVSGVCGWVSICVCMCGYTFLLVFMCMYVLSVASILAVFVLFLFGKTIRVIHRYYLPKTLCKKEESLLDILSLESQTCFSCNQKS